MARARETALITGASGGIGLELAQVFAEHGFDLIVVARREAELEALAGRCREKHGVRVHVLPMDLLVPDAPAELVRRLQADGLDVDVLVNNAGTGEAAGLANLSREHFDRVVELNLWAALRLAQLCYPGMQEKGDGVVINIASNDGLRPSAGVGAYGATKAALVNLTKQMAMEWAGDGIRAVCIAPGLVRTELAGPLVDYYESQGMELNLLKRVGEPEDIAGLALLLASRAGRFATAETFVLDGGELHKGHQL